MKHRNPWSLRYSLRRQLGGKDLDESGVVAVFQPVVIPLIDSRRTDAVDQSNQSRLGEWSWENNGF